MSELDSALPFITEDEYLRAGTVSNDAFLLGNLPPQTCRKWMKVGRTARVAITQVSSPYKFWFSTTQTLNDLKENMTSLGLMYRTCGTENFEIPNDCLRVGMVCAAVYQERWHRAEIVQIIDDDEVTVFYYDYGTTATISRYHVLYLHKEFADYQAEALRGCLDLVQPVGGTWTHDACKYFASITVSDPVYAEITSICSADHRNVFYLKLYEIPPKGTKTWNTLSEMMINKQYAYGIDTSLNKVEPRVYCETYPSFQQIENGLYPSMQTIQKLKKHNFDFHNYDHSIGADIKYEIDDIHHQ